MKVSKQLVIGRFTHRGETRDVYPNGRAPSDGSVEALILAVNCSNLLNSNTPNMPLNTHML
jgi:hypothetical protein